MTTANDRSGALKDYARDLVEAARDNPVPTALISMGITWMMIGGSTSSVFRKARDVGQTATASLGAGGRKVVDAASSLAATASETASAGLDTIADRASDVASTASSQLSKGSSQAASAGASIRASINDGLEATTRSLGASDIETPVRKVSSQAGGSAADMLGALRSGFADLLNRQPLVLGALGLAVGASVAAALPHIAAEDALTETVGRLKGSVRDGFSDAFDRASNEARKQGLTPEAASNAVADIGAKAAGVVKAAASDARSG